VIRISGLHWTSSDPSYASDSMTFTRAQPQGGRRSLASQDQQAQRPPASVIQLRSKAVSGSLDQPTVLQPCSSGLVAFA
jgi:hypothetical protein